LTIAVLFQFFQTVLKYAIDVGYIHQLGFPTSISILATKKGKEGQRQDQIRTPNDEGWLEERSESNLTAWNTNFFL